MPVDFKRHHYWKTFTLDHCDYRRYYSILPQGLPIPIGELSGSLFLGEAVTATVRPLP
jgi:hypothetical protein